MAHLAPGRTPTRAEDKTVPAQGKALISTGLAIAVPEGTYGRVAPRSGLGASHRLRPLVNPVEVFAPANWLTSSLRLSGRTASKHMIDTGAGVIDADYRGEVKVLLFNLSQSDFEGALGPLSSPALSFGGFLQWCSLKRSLSASPKRTGADWFLPPAVLLSAPPLLLFASLQPAQSSKATASRN